MKIRKLKNLCPGIKHAVQKDKGNLCIGSSYVHNILTIKPDLSIEYTWRSGRPFTKDDIDNDDLRKAYEEISALEKSELIDIMTGDDEKSDNMIEVFLVDFEGNIHKSWTEGICWPNVTLDGTPVYENTHFPSREEALKKALKDMLSGLKFVEYQIDEHVKSLDRLKNVYNNDRIAIEKICRELVFDESTNA